MKIEAVVVAAGLGRRMRIKKQFLEWKGKPIIVKTLEVFEKVSNISRIILVLPKKDVRRYRILLRRKYNLGNVLIIAGGKQRQDSVWQGLKRVSSSCDLVLIHDGVRPLVNRRIIGVSIKGARKYGACVVGLKAKETVKISNSKNFVVTTLPRQKIWLVQTPQVFRYKIIWEAYRKAYEDKFYTTDDAGLVERIGYKVKLVSGSEDNIKITSWKDFKKLKVSE